MDYVSQWLLLMGSYPESQPLYGRALAIREEQLGADHPYVAISLGNLGKLYTLMERFTEAEELFLRALPLAERVLGVDHPRTVKICNEYAESRVAMEKPYHGKIR